MPARAPVVHSIPRIGVAVNLSTRLPLIDKYRWLLLGSALRWGCKEMALCNPAYCHGQVGDGDRMREIHGKVLAEFPDNMLAVSALRMIDAVSGKRG